MRPAPQWLHRSRSLPWLRLAKNLPGIAGLCAAVLRVRRARGAQATNEQQNAPNEPEGEIKRTLARAQRRQFLTCRIATAEGNPGARRALDPRSHRTRTKSIGRVMQARVRDSLIGPRFEGEPAWLRYGLAIGLLACTAFARAELTPLIGQHSPLLPFVLPVLLSCYLCGRFPAWMVALGSPVLCTALFHQEFSWSDPYGWLAHVTFFVLICAALIEILHRLQVTHRRLLDSEALLLEADRRKNEF